MKKAVLIKTIILTNSPNIAEIYKLLMRKKKGVFFNFEYRQTEPEAISHLHEAHLCDNEIKLDFLFQSKFISSHHIIKKKFLPSEILGMLILTRSPLRFSASG